MKHSIYSKCTSKKNIKKCVFTIYLNPKIKNIDNSKFNTLLKLYLDIVHIVIELRMHVSLKL